MEFFRNLFDTSDWSGRWQTGNLSTFHGWLYIISDLLIWLAYFIIPVAIFRYVSRRVDSRFVRTYLLFAAFIFACGSTHLLDAISFWFPAYRLDALMRIITAAISWVTVFHLFRFIPTTSLLRTHAELEKEIRERSKIEDELNLSNVQLNIAQEIARVGHWQWNVSENKVTWSRELYKMYGVEENAELSYEIYLDQLHPEDKEFVSATIQRAFNTKSFPDFTHRLKLKDGTEKIIYSRGDVLVNEAGEVVKMIGTAQDITDQQIAQQKMLERAHDLENRNAELQKFAYVASHDLQEPLRKIITFASLLEKEVKGNLSDAAKLYMDKIVQSSGRMQRLIDDILQFSSLRASKEDYKTTDLASIIKHVLSDMEVKIANTNATIRVGELPVIEAIPSQIEQLFLNLISNAIKFKKENSEPDVEITSTILSAENLTNYRWTDQKNIAHAGYSYNWSKEKFVKIVIRDNGIGFIDAYSEKIFEIFQRLHANKTYEGTGIGLAIAKKIVDNHHGMISAESNLGDGATFIIILPLSQKNFFLE